MAKRKAEGFEDHLEALERIVDELESGELTLDDSLKRFEEGVARLKTCRELLDAAEDRVRILVRDADGELAEEPFESEEA
ncbi:MAG: exodeoxyribonuclease VII small subunit [Planctomycetota bacterium]|jgi:exodeoxyribonuclease VII small subunit